jgi:alkylation response protein AidB-like acyl-CoA dehydrogenase
MSNGLDKETLDMTLEAIREFAAAQLPEKKLLELDASDEFPEATVREMCGSGLGIQLIFIPEEFEGMGGGAFDVYRVCEEMARIDLGVSTGVLATFLGSDPIVFGGTYEQRKHWLTRIATEGLLMAYGATEPEAGSDLPSLRTTATPVVQDGKTVGYRINGNKQWISNGGYADLYTILALAPRRAKLVCGRKGCSRTQPWKTRRQTWDQDQQYGDRVARRRLCRRRAPDRESGGAGSDSGTARFWIHAPDGGGFRPWRRVGCAG